MERYGTFKAVVVYSVDDPASVNIAENLKQAYGFSEELQVSGYRAWYSRDMHSLLVELTGELIYAENLDRKLNVDAELLIFASRHESAAKKPALLVHAPGNIGREAKYGGLPRKVCIADAKAMSIAVRKIFELAREKGLGDWAWGMEVTHHGPYIESMPTMFIEIGSSIEEWRNKVAGEVVAETIHEVVTKRSEYSPKTIAMGVGGPHYAPKFNSLIIKDENVAIGHIIPNYVAEDLDEETLLHVASRHRPKINTVIVDRKGLPSAKRRWVIEKVKVLMPEIEVVVK